MRFEQVLSIGAVEVASEQVDVPGSLVLLDQIEELTLHVPLRLRPSHPSSVTPV